MLRCWRTRNRASSDGQPAGVDLVDAVAAAPGHRPVLLHPAQRNLDRGVMGGEHLSPHRLVAGEPTTGSRTSAPRTWRRIPGRRSPRTRDHPCGRSAGVGPAASGPAARATPPDPPPARRLISIDVVVDRSPAGAVSCQLIPSEALVVADQRPNPARTHLQPCHAHRHRAPARANAIVCPRGRGGDGEREKVPCTTRPFQGPDRLG